MTDTLTYEEAEAITENLMLALIAAGVDDEEFLTEQTMLILNRFNPAVQNAYANEALRELIEEQMSEMGI